MLRIAVKFGLAEREIKGCRAAMLNGRRLLLLQFDGVSTQSAIPGPFAVATLGMAVSERGCVAAAIHSLQLSPQLTGTSRPRRLK